MSSLVQLWTLLWLLFQVIMLSSYLSQERQEQEKMQYNLSCCAMLKSFRKLSIAAMVFWTLFSLINFSLSQVLLVIQNAYWPWYMSHPHTVPVHVLFFLSISDNEIPVNPASHPFNPACDFACFINVFSMVLSRARRVPGINDLAALIAPAFSQSEEPEYVFSMLARNKAEKVR